MFDEHRKSFGEGVARRVRRCGGVVRLGRRVRRRGGVVLAALGAWLSARISTALLRTLFGVFLLFVGISELRTRTD